MGDCKPLSLSIQDVVFTEATPHQRTLSWQLNGASWAHPMSIETYIGRERALSETTLSANGGTRYYILHPKDEPETIISGCEVSSKKALVADSNGCRSVDAYSIASVFTNPQYRGRGMASYMLRKVQEVVDRSTECGALYSDIGRKYYAGLGWPSFPSPQVIMSLEDGAAKDLAELTASAPVSLPAVSLLSEADIPVLCDKDVAALTHKFEELAKANDGKTHIAFLPSFVQFSWHFARDAYVGKAMQDRTVTNRGAITADGASWLYWDHDFREKKLKILRIVTSASDSSAKRAADIQALLLSALREALDWGIHKVLIWNPTKEASVAVTDIWHDLGNALRLVFDERQDGSIPSLRWKGGNTPGELVWEENEYFAWC